MGLMDWVNKRFGSRSLVLSLQHAADRGDVEAQFKLGDCYYNGDGVEEDINQAVSWYNNAAAQGHVISQYRLGCLYSEADEVTPNSKLAYKWLLRAAEQGLPQAQADLAVAYLYGDLGTTDLVIAEQWLQKAVKQNYPEAQYFLARLYDDFAEEYGLEDRFVTDDETVFNWYLAAAQAGFSPAQNELAQCWLEGFGTEQDITQAVHWYSESAQNGFIDAQWDYAVLLAGLDDEVDFPYDPEAAITWFRAAAEQGDDEYQLGFAECLYHGEGIPQDISESIYWCRQAAEQGSDEAKQLLARIETEQPAYFG